MKQTLYLIRHGHTAGTSGDFMYGATDLPLTDDGIAEVSRRADAGVYPTLENANLYSSGISRVEHTLRLIYGEAEHKIYENIREMSFGKYEMMPFEDILKDDWGRRWLAGEFENPQPEGGDSLYGYAQRVINCMNEIYADAAKDAVDKIIVVCHGGTIASVMETGFPGIASSIWDWVCEPGTGYEIEMEDGKLLSYKELK